MRNAQLLADLPAWCGDIHALVAPQWAGLIVTAVAVACGALIGIERERAEKTAGLRTIILICLGSTIFTQASLLIAGPDGDRGRIAAQVVTGIGFLGAGAIIRERGLLIGVTTGAGIWATAAVGVVIGTGHAAAGCVFAVLIVMTLSVARALERIVRGPCRMGVVELTILPRGGKTRMLIEDIVEDHLRPGAIAFGEVSDDRQTVTIRYCRAHRMHRAFLTRLAALKSVVSVVPRD